MLVEIGDEADCGGVLVLENCEEREGDPRTLVLVEEWKEVEGRLVGR